MDAPATTATTTAGPGDDKHTHLQKSRSEGISQRDPTVGDEADSSPARRVLLLPADSPLEGARGRWDVAADVGALQALSISPAPARAIPQGSQGAHDATLAHARFLDAAHVHAAHVGSLCRYMSALPLQANFRVADPEIAMRWRYCVENPGSSSLPS